MELATVVFIFAWLSLQRRALEPICLQTYWLAKGAIVYISCVLLVVLRKIRKMVGPSVDALVEDDWAQHGRPRLDISISLTIHINMRMYIYLGEYSLAICQVRSVTFRGPLVCRRPYLPRTPSRPWLSNELWSSSIRTYGRHRVCCSSCSSRTTPQVLHNV